MSKRFKFVSLLAPGTEIECDTFAQAFKPMYEWVDENFRKGSLSIQVLETSIWIEDTTRDSIFGPLFFYQARDRAIDEGILVDGKLVELPSGP